jgi:hypothetical protein
MGVLWLEETGGQIAACAGTARPDEVLVVNIMSI